MKKLFSLLIIAFQLVYQTSCTKDDNKDCSDLICTSEFKVIWVSVKDSNQTPVALDSFKVIDVSNGKDVSPHSSLFSLEVAKQLGEYPLVTDGSIELNMIRELQFLGFIDSMEVVSNNYSAKEERCGVNLISGNLKLTLN